MKMRLPILLLCMLFLGLASTTAANGWGSGLNFVPVIEETLATDETGNQMTLNSGTPVYLKPTDGVLDTWIRWEERPSERRVQIPRTALPQRLEGFRAYQRREFRRSTLLLESEAAAETHPLVRSWKYILAGHSHLLADSADYAGAIRLYRLVAQNPSNAFRADAQHLVVRALLNQKQYEEAREALVTLSRLLKDAPFHGGVLFSTYPLHSPVTAWVMGRRGGVEESLEALDAFMDAKKAFASRDDAREDSEDAEICYQLALATEGLWRVFPERFFDNTRAWHVPPLLELTFKDYPATEAAAKAYYHWLYYQQPWDFDGEQIEWERQQKELMERFLARYPDSSPAPRAQERLDAANNYISSHAE